MSRLPSQPSQPSQNATPRFPPFLLLFPTPFSPPTPPSPSFPLSSPSFSLLLSLSPSSPRPSPPNFAHSGRHGNDSDHVAHRHRFMGVRGDLWHVADTLSCPLFPAFPVSPSPPYYSGRNGNDSDHVAHRLPSWAFSHSPFLLSPFRPTSPAADAMATIATRWPTPTASWVAGEVCDTWLTRSPHPLPLTAADAMATIATRWPTATTSWVAGEVCDTWLGVVCDDSGYVTQMINVSSTDCLERGSHLLSSFAFSTRFIHTMPVSLSPSLTPSPPLLPPPSLSSVLHLSLSSPPPPNPHPPSPPPPSPPLSPLTPPSSPTHTPCSDLSDNDLEGTIPTDAIASLLTLQELKLHDNSIEDDFPAKFNTLTALQILTLGRNDITGSIPTGFSLLQKLRFLLLSDNRISGQVPSELGALTDLEALDLSKNRLSGSIPKEVIALPNLMYFDISNNEFSGPAPTGFASTSFQSTSEATYNIERNYFNGSAKGQITADNGNISFCPNQLRGASREFQQVISLRAPGAQRNGHKALLFPYLPFLSPCPHPSPQPLVNFNKYFRYVSLGYNGTATKPSWTYKTAVDWRTQVVSKQNRTVVGPTVDQGTCAACWALVPVAAIESAYAIAFGSNQPNISGQHILNCQGTWECLGGLPSDAFQFAASGGVLPEFIVPYTGTKDASSCPPPLRRRLEASFPPDLWFDRALEDHLHASIQDSSLQQSQHQQHQHLQQHSHIAPAPPSPPAALPSSRRPPPPPPPPPSPASIAPNRLPAKPSRRISQPAFEPSLLHPPSLPPLPPSSLFSSRFTSLLSSFFQFPRPRILQSSPFSSSSSSPSSPLPTSSSSSSSSSRSFFSSSRSSSIGLLKKPAKKKPPPAPSAQPVPGPYKIAMFEQVAVSGWLGMVIALQAQPIIANIEADQTSFIEYAGGYTYADPDCFINGVVNHIVLLVGYSMAGATPYFLLQNTWGATWGVGGFMQMAIASGDGICGINTSPALYPVVRGPNPCVPNPCGGGTCSATRNPGGYTCKCKTNFVVGRNIDNSPACIPLKPCSLNAVNPCQVGTCLDDGKGGYNCICPPGFFFDTRPDNTPSCILGPTPGEIHVVTGLTCDIVMSTYGINLTSFTQLNPNLNCNKLRPDDEIHIGDTNPCATAYTVTSSSDTCASIAAAFNVTTDQLKERNHELKCNKALQIGQQICVVRGTADLPVCQEYVTVAEGDTCDSIMRSARPPLTSQEFYALNPGINCNVGDQSLLGQQICTRGGHAFLLLSFRFFRTSIVRTDALLVRAQVCLHIPLHTLKMAAMLTSSLCSSNPAARLFPSLKPALSANAVQALTSRYSHSPLQLSSCTNRSRRLIVVEASSANPSQISFATAVESQPTLFQAIDFKKLQNGSDIRGVAIPGVEGEPVTLTEPAAEAIGAAFARLLRGKKEQADGQLSVSIGHDSRVSADVITAAVARGLAGEGVKVVRFGLASTPAMFSSTVTEDASLHCPNDGGIMITASHLPFNRNGLKFFTAKGGANKADIAAILASAAQIYESMSAESVRANQEKAEKQTVHVDYMKRYAADLVDAVRKAANAGDRPLEGYHIVVDAGNGAGGFFAAGVLEPLGANTAGSQFLEPDGLFPNHIPNPEDKAAMEAITGAVLREKADLGIIFDTDVDRAAAVDSSGKEINRNRLIALIAAIVLEEHPGTTIVTDSVTSDGLTTFIESKLGGKHLRFKRGYKNVIDEGIRLNSVGEECHLAMETSGHGALKENRWLDDGAYLMVKLLVKLASAAGKGEAKGSVVLTRMIEDLQEADEATEVRLRINQDHADVAPIGFRPYGEKVLEALTATVESDAALSKAPVNYEGVRVSGFGGWFLLRLSLHDPVLPLNIEGPSKAATRRLAEAVVYVTSQFPALDTSALHKYIDSCNHN
ncbi:unnamed protein product [Closterium sp. Yama58-4]|nr:unnamed protein product [Closterium sp. Yama58-4]